MAQAVATSSSSLAPDVVTTRPTLTRTGREGERERERKREERGRERREEERGERKREGRGRERREEERGERKREGRGRERGRGKYNYFSATITVDRQIFKGRQPG